MLRFTYKTFLYLKGDFMSVNLSSNQPFPTQQEFNEIKQALGEVICLNIVNSLGECTYGVDTKQGKKRLDSKNIIKGTITLDKTAKASFEFYADFFLSENLPKNYQMGLDNLLNTKTKKAAFKVLFKVSVEILKQQTFNADLIMKSEKIKNLKESSCLKVAVAATLQHSVIKNPEISFLCEDKFYKNWT